MAPIHSPTRYPVTLRSYEDPLMMSSFSLEILLQVWQNRSFLLFLHYFILFSNAPK